MASQVTKFMSDLDKCLKLAEDLADAPDENTRIQASKSLEEMQKFLQKKQEEAERRLNKEIEEEEQEIESIKERIKYAEQGSTPSRYNKDILSIWIELKEKHWQKVFDTVTRNTTSFSETEIWKILEALITVLKACFERCKRSRKVMLEGILFQTYFPGKSCDTSQLKLPKTTPEDLEMCSQCLDNTAEFCLPSIQMAIKQDVKSDETYTKVQHIFQSESEVTSEALNQYIDKCVEFSWLVLIEDSDTKLVTAPQKECKKLLSQFHKEHAVASRKVAVEWPALVQGDRIKSIWTIYEQNNFKNKLVSAIPRTQLSDSDKVHTDVDKMYHYETKDNVNDHEEQSAITNGNNSSDQSTIAKDATTSGITFANKKTSEMSISNEVKESGGYINQSTVKQKPQLNF